MRQKSNNRKIFFVSLIISWFIFIQGLSSQDSTFVIENIPVDTTITCDNFDPFPENLIITDTCETQPVITVIEQTDRGNEVMDCSFYNYVVTRKYTVTNECGDSISFTHTITVIDTFIEDFIVPPNVTVNCNQIDDLSLTGDLDINKDQCGGPIFKSYFDEFPDTICGNTVIRNWVVNDICGNVRIKQQELTVIDDTPPFFNSPPQNLIISCDEVENPYPVFNEWVKDVARSVFSDQCHQEVFSFAAVPGSYDINDPSTFPGIHPGALDPVSCSSDPSYLQIEMVDFVIYDACGNATMESASFLYQDREAPILADCSETIEYAISDANCDTLLNFEVPVFSDACELKDITVNISQELELESSEPNSTEIPVEDLNFELVGYGPEIEFEEENYFSVMMNNIDADHAEERFSIYDEDGNFLMFTPMVDFQCSSVGFQLGPFAKTDMEKWASDGIINFLFENNISESDSSNTINDICTDANILIEQNYIIPVNPIETKIFFQVDNGAEIEINGIEVAQAFSPGEHVARFIARDCSGNESICEKIIRIRDTKKAMLNCPGPVLLESQGDICDYPIKISELIGVVDSCGEDNFISIEIAGQMNLSVEGYYSEMAEMEIFVPLGISNATVSIEDYSGNGESCSFPIVVEDIQNPTAVCGLIEIPVIAVELDFVRFDPNEIGASSFDNCQINFIQIINNNYQCADLNSTVGRTMIVSDPSGNTDNCVVNLFLKEADVPVNVSLGVCPNDSLKFEIGIDHREEYKYRWRGPKNFFSVEEIPFILNADITNQGEYTLELINDETGCVSYATFEVDFDLLQTPKFTTDTIGCETLAHVLEAEPFEDAISYEWFEKIDGSIIPLSSSASPITSIDLEPGFRELLMRVQTDECESRFSETILVDVRPAPSNANICATLVEGCIGMPLDLCVLDPQETWKIRWFGPNGYTSEEVSPTVTDSFTSDFSGIYKLVIEDDLCITDTLTTAVTTNPSPPKPKIIGSMKYCEGDTLVLASEEIGLNYFYIWNTPNGEIRSNEPVLRIPMVSDDFSGMWSLSLEQGPCSSEPSELVEIYIEPRLLFSIAPIPNQCEGTEIQFSPTIIPESQYSWTGPDGFMTNAVRPVLEAKPGVYSVTAVTFNGCRYNDAIEITTTKRPAIESLSSDESGPCVNNFITVNLSADITNDEDITYNWEGPVRNSEDPIFSIEDFTDEDVGVYTLTVSNGACVSEKMAINVDLIIKPSKPILTGSPVACEGSTITITSNNYTGNPRFFWNTPLGILETENNILVIEDVQELNEGFYSLAVVDGTCTSDVSDRLFIEINDDNFVPEVNIEGDQCVLENIKLYSDLSGLFDLEWELPDGTIVFSDTIRITESSLQDTGTYRVRSISNTCPSDWSEYFSLQYEDPRKNVAIANDYIFTCNNEDADVEFCIEDNSGLSGKRYKWYYEGQFLGETMNTCFSVPDLSIFEEGVNQIELRVAYEGCELMINQPMFLEIENVLDIDLDAGMDQTYCVGQTIELMAEEPESGSLTGFWSTQQSADFDDINSPFSTVVINEKVDEVLLLWNIEHITCGIVYRDTVKLSHKLSPEAVNDTIVTDSEIVFEPLLNDVLQTGEIYEINITSEPRWGDVNVSGNVLRFDSDPKFAGGRIDFNYEVCEIQCPELCDEGDIIVLYKLGSCRGNNVLTPNNDGSNDMFIIPCLEEQNLPENELIIVNEVGNTVYQKAPYDNSWDGTFNGEVLPEGTYYYFFKRNPEGSIIQGFIAIER